MREVLSRKEAYEYDKKGDLFETLYQSIINDIKSGRISSYRSPRGTMAPLRVNDNNRIEYRPKDKSPKCEKEDNIKLMFNYLSQNKIYDLKLYKRKDYEDLISKLTYGETKTLDYVEYGWILQELLNRIPKSVRNGDANISKDSSPTKYIFIIDEINRGEISKIFGELFFSIDPGYRGMEGRVKTQYQNLITDESDPFFDGFYVPDNVYIIGTMNDIDRSVESMDFAMRRRFAWEEIMANDNIDMLDELRELKDDVVGKMRNLNAAIESIEGLNSSYHIGAAYFRKLTSYLNKDNTNLQEAYKSLWDNHLRGVLSEYLRGSMNMMENLKNLEEKYNKANESVKSEG